MRYSCNLNRACHQFLFQFVFPLFVWQLLATTFAGSSLQNASSQQNINKDLIDPIFEAANDSTMDEHQGYRTVAYYVNWANYGRKHKPTDVPVQHLTHILYAFADVRSESGEVFLTDKWADEEMPLTGHDWNDPDVNKNLYGLIGELNLLKKRNRNLKVLLSIGGWTYSPHFAEPMSKKSGRQKFATSALDILMNYGFDGIDIDWEYPQNDQQAKDMVYLFAEVRHQLDLYEKSLVHEGHLDERPHFELTIAAPAGAKNYEKLQLGAMEPYLDYINLMAYDFAGSWDQTAGHQANLFPNHHDPRSTPFNTAQAMKYYTSHGIPPHKMVLGMPLYGRAFENTDGPGKPYSGIGEPDSAKGSWESGVWEFKALPQPGHKEYHRERIGASWSYSDETRTMISYDTKDAALQKADFIGDLKLGGAMWWETSGDKSGGESLITTVHGALEDCDEGIEQKENVLKYPHSRFLNLKNGFSNV